MKRKRNHKQQRGVAEMYRSHRAANKEGAAMDRRLLAAIKAFDAEGAVIHWDSVGNGWPTKEAAEAAELKMRKMRNK